MMASLGSVLPSCKIIQPHSFGCVRNAGGKMRNCDCLRSGSRERIFRYGLRGPLRGRDWQRRQSYPQSCGTGFRSHYAQDRLRPSPTRLRHACCSCAHPASFAIAMFGAKLLFIVAQGFRALAHGTGLVGGQLGGAGNDIARTKPTDERRSLRPNSSTSLARWLWQTSARDAMLGPHSSRMRCTLERCSLRCPHGGDCMRHYLRWLCGGVDWGSPVLS